MWKMEPGFSVRLGGNKYINTPNLVVYRGKPVFCIRRRLADGILDIEFHVYDKDGQRVAAFARGVVIQGDKASYDIQTDVDAYAVTEHATGRVIARVLRRGHELDVHVHMYMPDGFLLDAGPHRTNIGGGMLTGHVFEDCAAGITIE
jgi:hypothetical protein